MPTVHLPYSPSSVRRATSAAPARPSDYRWLRAQHGIALFISLIALAVLSIAAVTLLRSVTTGVQISGNLAFRNAAVHGADAAIESARTWLAANSGSATLNADNPANGYYATDNSSVSVDVVHWDQPGGHAAGIVPVALNNGDPEASTGNRYSYFITRLCANSGGANDPNQSCLAPVSTSSSNNSTKTSSSYGSGALQGGGQQVYYKVTVRIDGPRNTVSYIQAVLLA